MQATRSIGLSSGSGEVSDHATYMPVLDAHALMLVSSEDGVRERSRANVPGQYQRFQVGILEVEMQPEEPATERVEVRDRLVGCEEPAATSPVKGHHPKQPRRRGGG